jgi:hypothetical protein
MIIHELELFESIGKVMTKADQSERLLASEAALQLEIFILNPTSSTLKLGSVGLATLVSVLSIAFW